MKVRATKNGFYQNMYRYAGDVFMLVPVEGFAGVGSSRKKVIVKPEEQFADSWMEKIDSKKVSAPVQEAPKAPAPATGSGAPTGDDDVI